MKSDTIAAIKLLRYGEYTCVFCKGGRQHTCKEPSTKALLHLVESGTTYRDFCAAGKEVGKAEAFLYILLEVREVYADIMSEAAIYTLAKYGIRPICNRSVKELRSLSDSENCPAEDMVKGITTPVEALKHLKLGCF